MNFNVVVDAIDIGEVYTELDVVGVFPSVV
jgi:hypothetical protein